MVSTRHGRALSLAVGLAVLIGACGPSTRYLPRAVVTVCNAALIESPSTLTFVPNGVVAKAKSWGGSVFARDVDKWLAITDANERVTRANMIVQDCHRIGGFLTS